MAIDNTGRDFHDDLPKTLSYNPDGTLATITVTRGSNTWVQTYTYTDGKLTAVSGWVLQA